MDTLEEGRVALPTRSQSQRETVLRGGPATVLDRALDGSGHKHEAESVKEELDADEQPDCPGCRTWEFGGDQDADDDGERAATTALLPEEY